MKLEHRENRGKNNHALYGRSSWTGPDIASRTRKRGDDDEIPTPSHSVKPSSSPARKKSKIGVTRKGKSKLKNKRRRNISTQKCHVTDRSGSCVDVDVNYTDQAETKSNGNSCVVSNVRPSY